MLRNRTPDHGNHQGRITVYIPLTLLPSSSLEIDVIWLVQLPGALVRAFGGLRFKSSPRFLIIQVS